MDTVDFKATGRTCVAAVGSHSSGMKVKLSSRKKGCGVAAAVPKPVTCGGLLRDNILDWDSALPDDELEAACNHASEAVS